MLKISVQLENGDTIDYQSPNLFTEFKLVGSDEPLPNDLSLFLDGVYSFADAAANR